MDNITQFAFYGSLRRGMYNYDKYRDHLDYQCTQKLEGFCLYAVKDYPIAVKTGNSNDQITIEIFKINNKTTELNIHSLELSAGYYLDTLLINNINTGIYLFEHPHNYSLIKDGDWVVYFDNRLNSK